MKGVEMPLVLAPSKEAREFARAVDEVARAMIERSPAWKTLLATYPGARIEEVEALSDYVVAVGDSEAYEGTVAALLDLAPGELVKGLRQTEEVVGRFRVHRSGGEPRVDSVELELDDVA